MDNESVRNNDPIQLQQMIIFLRAELAKYKNEVERLRDSDYYSLVLRLERENVQLTNREKELTLELIKLKRELEKEATQYQEDIQMREIQRKKHVSSIEALLKDKNDLRMENEQLMGALKAAEDELRSFKKERQEVMVADYKTAIENLENKLIDFTEITNKQMENIVEELGTTRRELSGSDNINYYLVKEIEEKRIENDKLLDEIAELNHHIELLSKSNPSLLSGKNILNSQVFSDLDAQVKKILDQSVGFEGQLDAKLRILDDLEQKLNQLAIEIEVNRTM
ncbi:chromosome segregation ATPase [Lysinibacillus parviboronicapiens]|uniref:Chromosome segregation ATPase n=1 Tax=Lysinibacillus parviboronicapiens TaxID=436516 RepID=A0ABV2PKE1_9BACI